MLKPCIVAPEEFCDGCGGSEVKACCNPDISDEELDKLIDTYLEKLDTLYQTKS